MDPAGPQPPAATTPPPARGRPGRRLIPHAVLVVALALTAGMTAYVWATSRARDRARFENLVERTASSIERRLETYVNLLRAGGGLFAAGDRVTADDWRAFVDRLGLEERYPGMQGIGFSARVPAADLDSFLVRMRAEHGGSFRVEPAHEREDYHAIAYLEPPDERNRRAIGFDMHTEPVRRAAMERARDTGQAAASGRVTLVQEIEPADVQAGFLIYVPVYRGGAIPATIDARRAALDGFVYAPFRADDLLRGIFGDESHREVHFRVYDGTDVAGPALMHGSDPRASAASPAGLRAARRIDVAGRTWTIAYEPGPAFARGSAGNYTPPVALAGLAASGVLFALALAQARAAGAAERAAAALRASESKLRRLVESNLIGVVFSDVGGRVRDGNDAFFEMTAYARDDFRRGRVGWDTITPPEYRAADERAIADLRERGVCAPYEKELVRSDGARVPALIGAALLEGSATECVVLCVDLSARKRAEEDLRDAKRSADAAREAAEAARAEAERANRLKDEFLATVSHELRTPLNAILGWAQLLRSPDAQPEEDLALGLETIERNARAQAQLVEDLLDVSRIVSGKLRLDVRAAELGPVVDGAIDACRPAAAARGVGITRTIHPDAGPVTADPDRVQQVVWNLVSNAVKFTPRGGQVRVEVRRAAGGDRAEIAVTDTGQGIAAEFIPLMFDRFRQGDGSITRKHGGLGLGLSIVRHLVELHGGTVRASSPGPGKGATFVVTLPQAQAAPTLEASPSDRASSI